MFRDNHKETDIELESYRLKLWYYYDVMTSFFSVVLIHFKWIKYNNKNEIKNEYCSFKIDILHLIYFISISKQDEV